MKNVLIKVGKGIICGIKWIIRLPLDIIAIAWAVVLFIHWRAESHVNSIKRFFE